MNRIAATMRRMLRNSGENDCHFEMRVFIIYLCINNACIYMQFLAKVSLLNFVIASDSEAIPGSIARTFSSLRFADCFVGLHLRTLRSVAESGDILEIASENGFIEIECFFGITVEVKVWIECCHC